MRKANTEQIEAEIAALADLTRDELAERWAAAYGCPAPRGMQKNTLLYAAAWHLQAKQLGGFTPETRRLLKRAIHDLVRETQQRHCKPSPADSTAAEAPRRSLAPGARLLREWNGRTNVVDATERGFLFQGETYRSLSAVAREITGAHWSGPRFFGL